MAIDEFSLPGGLRSPEHKALNSLEVALGRDSEELAEKRSAPRRVIVYVFMQEFIDPGEAEQRGDVEVGSDVSEGLSRNAEEGCSTLWERRRVVALVKVSMLGSLTGGEIRVFFLIRGVSERFCRLVEHKLGEARKTGRGRRHPAEMTTIERTC